MAGLPEKHNNLFDAALYSRLANLAGSLMAVPPVAILETGNRSQPIAHARWLVFYGLHIGAGWSIWAIAKKLEMDHSSVIYGLRRIQELAKDKGKYASYCRKMLEEADENKKSHHAITKWLMVRQSVLSNTIEHTDNMLFTIDRLLNPLGYRLGLIKLKEKKDG